MISIQEAKKIAEQLIKNSGRNLTITSFSEIHSDDADRDLYIFSVADKDTDESFFFGELFPAIRKSDGKLVDFPMPPPGF
jgi:hypothetical protein